MSTEVKKEGETKDNTHKKKELEDKIAKISVKGTEESLKCFEELKRLNKTLNETESVEDVSKIYKTIFPKFDDQQFTKIRNAVLKSREIKGGVTTPYDEAMSDEGPGSVYIFDIQKMLPGFKYEPLIQEINRLISINKRYIMVKVLSNTNSTLNLEIHSIIEGVDEKVYSILVLKNELDKTFDSTDKTLGTSLKELIDKSICNSGKDQKIRSKLFRKFLAQDDWIPEISGISPHLDGGFRWFTGENSTLKIPDFKQNETGVVFESGGKFYVYWGKEKNNIIRIGAASLTTGTVGATVGFATGGAGWLIPLAFGAAGPMVVESVGRVVPKTIEAAKTKLKKENFSGGGDDNINLGKFYEVTSVQTKEGELKEMSMEIKNALDTAEYKNCTLKIQDINKEEFDQAKAQEILLDYQTAFFELDNSLLPDGISNVFCFVDEFILDPTIGSSFQGFSQKWKETKKAAIKRNPGWSETLTKLSSLSQESIQGTINNLTDEIKKTVTLQNKKGKVAVGALGIAEALYPGVSSGVGQYLLTAISSHPVLAGIALAAVVAAKHFKPGEPDDYLTMYMGTELAPQLQIFERKRLTAKTGTTGDLGLTYTKFVTEVLVPKAKGYLTGSELISLITNDNVLKSVTVVDNFKKFETELTLKGGSLNLDTLLGQKLDARIDSEISKLEAKAEQIQIQIGQLEGDKVLKQANALEQQARSIKGEIKAKKDEKEKFSKTLDTTKEEITTVVIKYLNGGYGSKGGGPVDEKDKDEVIQTLTELLKSREIAEKISENILKIIHFRIEITKLVEQLKNINSELEEVSPKELSKLEQVSKGTHPMIYAKFVKTFGSEKGDKMFSKVFSSTIKRTMSAEENLATLFDENRRADLERVLVDENSITRAKLQELCNSYKEELAKKAEKKKKVAEEKKAREDKLKGKKALQTSTTSQGEDIDVSGITSSISGLATSAYDKLTGLTGLVKDEKDKMSKDTLTPDLKTGDLQLKEVKSEKRTYKPGDHKPEDLTTITRKELDELRESEETLRKQLEMDRAIIRQYKQNIEHDISEHYKVLKMKEEQLLQKSDYVLREQQKIVAYYMGVLQNRESIIMEQERLLEIKRKRELEEIEELRASIQRKLIKELEKEKKMMLKHHSKQMRKQKSLLQEELNEYTGDNLYLTRLASKTKSDKGSLKKNGGMIIQKSFMNTFVY